MQNKAHEDRSTSRRSKKASNAAKGSNDRKRYELKMEEWLKEVGANIDDWADKTHASDAIVELRKRQDDTSKKLKELQTTSTEAWDAFKLGVDHACEELSIAFDEFRNGSAKAVKKFKGH